MPRSPQYPVVRHGDAVRRRHGEEVPDPFAWLADPSDPEVLAHLEAENAYADDRTEELGGLRHNIFNEIRCRTKESDTSVPVLQRGWWYYARTGEGKQYGTHCRIPASDPSARPDLAPGEAPPGEQVLLDGDAEAAGSDFFALGGGEVDPTDRRFAYLVDVTGDERFTLRVRDIDTGAIVEEAVTGAGYGVVWSLDARHLLYTRVDASWRPHEVWRHEVGTPAGDDVLVLAEPDERFWLGIDVSRDERRLVVAAASKSTSQAWLLDLADPTGPVRAVAERREGVEYDVEPAGDLLFVVHNARRPDFEVAWAPIDATSHADWRPWPVVGDGERVLGVDAFARHVVLSLRSDGLPRLRVVPWEAGGGPPGGEPWDLPVEEELATVALGDNPAWETDRVLVDVESFVTPTTVSEYDLGTGRATVVRRRPVLGGFDPGDYRQRREWAVADDGTRVPISIVHHAATPLDGTAPGLLMGYGAYEASLDPWFSIPRLSLLDRGLVVAIAHVRGGGEFGRAWYEQGRLEHKATSFTDLVACARHLADGLVDAGRLGLEGGSAGGLLVGAAVNLAPELFRVLLAQVPFVDALTTMLDPSLPLTVTEWEEWGDPLHDADAYRRMRAYTPYENVAATRYPAILATTSLHDTRVSYAEPAKWVARLRETATNDRDERPILLRTEMSAGHGGRSGRYDAWREYAWETAFVLDALGATERIHTPTGSTSGSASAPPERG